VVFLFALAVVADDLLVQRTGLQRRKRRCTSYWVLAVMGLYVSTSSLVARARGFRDGAPRVQGVPTAIAPLKDMEICNQYIFFLASSRVRAEHAFGALRSRTRTTHWWQPPALCVPLQEGQQVRNQETPHNTEGLPPFSRGAVRASLEPVPWCGSSAGVS
jgi:hypothetical protein